MAAPFCGCWGVSNKSEEGGRWASPPPPRYTCRCAEHNDVNEWEWEPTTRPSSTHVADLSECRREVTFHRMYSSGTAVVQGSRPFLNDHVYYWEIKILTALYGTDVMIGVGSPNVDFNTNKYQFTSFLGLDAESYGFSYTGKVQHDGQKRQYSQGFGKGVIVGVYLDMWHGTLEFYINRKPMGVAFRGLKRHPVLYPMVSSTASQSAIRLIYSMSKPCSLIFQCAKSLIKCPSSYRALHNIPGLKSYFKRAFWILLPSYRSEEDAIYWSNKDYNHEAFLNDTPNKEEKYNPSHMNIMFEQLCSNGCINTPSTKITTDHPTGKAKLCNQLSCEASNGENPDKYLEGNNNLKCKNTSDDDLWTAALEPTTLRDDTDVAFKHPPIALCQTCNLRMAIVTVHTTQRKQCRECFQDS